MEITNVEAINLDPDLGDIDMRLGASDQQISVRPVLVKIHTNEGITGIGETLAYNGPEASVIVAGIESLEDRIVGEDPRAVKKRWQELYTVTKRSLSFKPLSAIDEAVWDIKGKDAEKPLYQLLGGRIGSLSAYATFPYRKSTDALIESGQWLAEKGFDSMKITVGRDAVADRKRIRSVADSLSDGFGLSIDANTSYEFSEAIKVAETGSEVGLEWFEEPIPHTNIGAQAELNHRTSVPIAAYQSHMPHYPAVQHLEQNALEIYQPSLYICGGVTGANRVATLTEAYNKQIVPHAFGPLVNYAASVHVSLASPVCNLIEFAIYDETIDDPGRYVSSPYVQNQDAVYVADDGTIEPPEEPGLGIELDTDAVEEFRVN